MDLSVRKVRKNDISQVIELCNLCFREYTDLKYAENRNYDISDKDYDKNIK